MKMEILEQSSATATLRFQKQEIILLANALNETLEAIEEWEVPIRVGAETAEVQQLHRELRAILAKMRNLMSKSYDQ